MPKNQLKAKKVNFDQEEEDQFDPFKKYK